MFSKKRMKIAIWHVRRVHKDVDRLISEEKGFDLTMTDYSFFPKHSHMYDPMYLCSHFTKSNVSTRLKSKRRICASSLNMQKCRLMSYEIKRVKSLAKNQF